MILGFKSCPCVDSKTEFLNLLSKYIPIGTSQSLLASMLGPCAHVRKMTGFSTETEPLGMIRGTNSCLGVSPATAMKRRDLFDEHERNEMMESDVCLYSCVTHCEQLQRAAGKNKNDKKQDITL
jgi:hypothetical protein